MLFRKMSFQFSFCNRNEKKGTVSVGAFSNPTINEKGNCIHDIKMCDREDISKGDLRQLLALHLDNYKKKIIVHDNVGH